MRCDRRSNGDLTFPLEKRIKNEELHHWVQKVSILPFVEGLAVKAGPIDRKSADAYLEREIMCTGMTLAALLQEFHSNPIVY